MKTTSILLVVFLILFSSCSESVLSDIDISDPGTLKVKVKIEQNEDNDKEVQVFVRDKNNRPIDFLTGKVIVNNTKVRFQRAKVNSLGARGYIYVPANNEQEFEITIFWNTNDSYSFGINEDNGFQGFFCNAPHYSCNDGSVEYFSHDFVLKPTPFYDYKIDVECRILY